MLRGIIYSISSSFGCELFHKRVLSQHTMNLIVPAAAIWSRGGFGFVDFPFHTAIYYLLTSRKLSFYTLSFVLFGLPRLAAGNIFMRVCLVLLAPSQRRFILISECLECRWVCGGSLGASCFLVVCSIFGGRGFGSFRPSGCGNRPRPTINYKANSQEETTIDYINLTTHEEGTSASAQRKPRQEEKSGVQGKQNRRRMLLFLLWIYF